MKKGVRDAGGTPLEFNTIAINDAIAMGTEGMKASLISREVIADSMELVRDGLPVRRDGHDRRLRQDATRMRDGDGADEPP